MANLDENLIDDYFPADGDTGVPLRTEITITFSKEMNTERLEEDFLLEGPDTDQFVGPGLLQLNPTYTDNVSQGDPEDFLSSPGLKGIVPGSFEFETVSGVSTKLIFTPAWPLAGLTEYTAYIRDTADIYGEEYEGCLSFSFETGSGAIEELPASGSSSVIHESSTLEGGAGVSTALAVSKTTPEDHAVQQSPELDEVVIHFNKELDPDTISGEDVTVRAIPATDHPEATITAGGDLAKIVEVDGNRLKIKI